MTLCVNHVTLATVRGRYLKKSVRLISPEGLRVKNPNLIFIILAYRATLIEDHCHMLLLSIAYCMMEI